MTDQLKQRIIMSLGSAAIVLLVAYIIFGGGQSTEQGRQQTPVAEASNPLGGDAALIGQKAAEAEIIKPAFDLVRISRGGTGVIAGKMAPGAEVRLFANGKKISEVTADENGEWIMILDEPLEAGSVELNLIGKQAEGQDETEADGVVVVSVPERDTERFVEREENGVVAVLSPKSGEGGSRILQKPGAAAFAEVGESLRVETIDYGAGATVVAGRALPRVEVRLYLDGVFKGNTKANDDGFWSMEVVGELDGSEHIVRLDQTLTGGDVQLRIEQPFQAGRVLDLSAAESGVIIKPGNTLWQIARRLYGSGVRYTLIFKENSEKIQDPNMIFPGQVFKLPTE